MGYSRVGLLLLLSGFALAQQGSDNNEPTSACQLVSRFKTYRKYFYQYTTESRNGVVGTANLRNGPKVTCKVEIEVPQACSFIMHTTECAVSEVSVMDPQGQLVYTLAPGSEAFQAAMEKNPLKFTVENALSVQLYSEADEPVNILNIKRGIISALLAPATDEHSSVMSTVHGQCRTGHQVNAMKDIAVDVTLSRDLSQCDQFNSRKLANSPLALLKNMHYPLSKLITSTQQCNYQLDNKGKHITAVMCTEKHIYLPFSHQDNGMSSVITQELNFQNSKRINNRVFDVSNSERKPLHFEDPDDKAPVQTKDAALNTLQELLALAGTDQGQKRTSLFHKLVSSLRVLRNETLSQTVTEMMDMSVWITWQALFQCGTSECTSAMFQAIWRIDGASVEVDALVYALSLQTIPTASHLRDMLSMAQYRQSKGIMYALANTVKLFYKGEVTPEIRDVAMFMEEMLNDCSGELGPNMDPDVIRSPEDLSYLVLRVVGAMGQAMHDASPSLVSSVLRCAKKTDAPLSNQKAAVQAFRHTIFNDEVKSTLLEIYQDTQSNVEKRAAAYLILMNNMDEKTANTVVDTVEDITEEELKTFVITHLNNVIKTDLQASQYIKLAVQNKKLPTLEESGGKSRSYMIDALGASVKSNIIFDESNTLPKDVTLDASFNHNDIYNDIFKFHFEGTGFEPTVDALFGENGFFPESFFKLTNWGEDRAQMLRDLMNSFSGNGDRMKRQVPDDLLREITNGVQKLMEDLRSSPAPEAIAYFELLGNEMGYMKASEFRDMLETLLMYYHVYFRVLPTSAFLKLTSSTDNEVFAHYIFMENSFSLPTVSGLPLKFSLAGVFAPGAKGGLTFSPSMGELSFMPSVGVEFITHMGVHIPDYVEAGLEMHTNMYQESSLNAKVNLNKNQIKLTIPAPTSNTQLFSISNKVLSVSAGQTKIVPSLVEDRADSTDCQPLISGLKLCTIVRYSNATSIEQAPYYPLTGESTFAVEIQPTGEVSEYIATMTREMLREGKEGRHKVTSLKFTLKAEGADSAEATASLKYNHNKNTVTTEFNIPDYDVEAGIKFAVSDDSQGTGMRGITIDVTNKNIPQLSLIGRTRLEMMKEAMLQLQMTVPSLNADASLTASLKKDEIIIMDIETAIKLPETIYQQKASLKYDDDKIELELKSDANSDIQRLIPNAEEHHRELQQLIDKMLDQKVAKTDMKLRHIVTKMIEAANIWLDKLTVQFPHLENLRSKRSISDLTLPPLPEKLFLQYDGLFRYQFNKDRMAFSLHLPLGGKTSKELNIPALLSVPEIDLTKIGLYIPANNVKLPQFTIPPSLDFTVPLLGLAEASAKINSNFYSWEGSLSGGNNTVDVPSFVAHYKIMAQSPFCVLSYKLEGTGMVSGSADDSLKYLLSNSFNHCLIDTSFSVVETLRVTDKLNAKADYKIEISSPLGLETTWFYSAQATSTLEPDEVSGDGTLDGKLQIGSFNADTSYTQSYNLRPVDREGRGESSFVFNSPLMKLQNIIQGVYSNSELNIISKTNALNDDLKHIAELKYKDAQLTLKCNGMATGKGTTLSNKVELGVSSQMALFRIESQADDVKNRLYSLITGSLDFNGLEVNSEGSLTFEAGRGLHKASLTIGRNGLMTSGTNNIQCSPVTVENVFNGAIDSSGAMFSTKTKAMADEGRGELNIDGQITTSEASLQGVLKGHAFDGTTRNNMNIVVNRRGLTFTADTMGSVKQMKTENSHSLTVTLWTLNLHSQSNNIICEDVFYKQDTKVNLKPFIMAIDMTNELKLYEVSLNNEGHMKLQPTQVDLSGNVMGAFGEDSNLKHTYEMNFAGLEGALKYNTAGNVMDAQLSHNCELEFAGLSSTTKCEARINSRPLRLDSTLRIMALPFSLTIDGLVNSDGEIKLNGKHTGQLYSRLLFKGEPLSLTYTYDNRLSTTHMPRLSGESSTHLDSKLEGLVTPNNQYINWKLKSKLNNHAYNQDVSAYNNPEKIGAEFSGVALTDLFSTFTKETPVDEELSVTGFLKYDKNSDCHIIEIPFIESFPAAFELVKTALIQGLESIQQFINDLDINQLITDFRAKLDQFPKQVGDFMQEIDLENKVAQVKDKLDYMANEFSVTMGDLEKIMKKLRVDLEETVIDIATKIKDFIVTVKDYVQAGDLDDKITNVLQKMGEQLWAFDEKYEIKQSLVKVLDAIEDILRQIDLQKLTESSTAWLRDLDAQYGILDKIKDMMSEIKQAVENFDIKMFFQDIKDYILSFDLTMYIEQLQYTIPYSDIQRVMENMNDVIVNWIDEYEIPQKLNAVYSYIKDQLLKYNLDKKLKELMDQLVILIEEFKIEDTVQSIVDALKGINFEYAYDKVMHLLQSIMDVLKDLDFKKIIEDLNNNIFNIVRSMKEFDYNIFVDETNKKIVELTDYINEQIKTYEIVEKIEAVREFFREIQNTVYTYLDGLKNTRVADALVKLKNVIDTTFYNDVKLKALDVLDDIQQRISNMDIRDEMYVYLQRASEFYSNTVDLISEKLNQLIEEIAKTFKDSDIFSKVKAALEEVLNALKEAEIEVPAFTLPLTDLVIPQFTLNLNKLEEISIPAQISIPEFTILNTYTVPAYTIDFEEIKAKLIAVIDNLKMFEIQMPDPNEIFGDLKVLYLSELPDLTFPEITLSEIKIPAITVPKLNMDAFEITMLPLPAIELPEIPSDICIPVFGKLYGEFRVNSPDYTLVTTGKIENATSTSDNPQFTATLNSQAISQFKPLEYTLEVDALLEAPRLEKMLFTETLKGTHMFFSIDHEGLLTLTSSSAEAAAKTTAKATAPIYTADLQNNIVLTLKGGISANVDTMYNHNLDIPSLEVSSQATVKQTAATTLESGKVTVTAETTANGKWSLEDYSDEGVHKNKLDFNLDLGTAKLTFEGETDSKSFKSKEMLTAESVILSHIIVEARCEMDIPSLQKSVSVLRGEAHVGDLKLALTASHDAEFTGSVKGSMTSSLEFMAHPFEITLDAKNKVNTKISLPLKLTGKVDLQNDYCLILNSEKQRACWFALARFNQYKYNHNFTNENNDKEIFFHSAINGEANLDFLTVPLSIPEMTVPYLEINTPVVTDFSLWEHAGLKYLLTTPQQSFDFAFKLHYYKNPETHSFDLYLEPVYNAISDNMNVIQEQFEMYRDRIVSLLKESHSQVKKRYIDHKRDTSSLPHRIITIPGYKIPLLNIEVSAFRAELPAFSYVVPKEVSTPSFKIPALRFSVPSYTLVLPSLELPIIHVPETLSEIQLPTFTFPDIQNNIVLPAMGNLTLDFSFKSAVITVSANAGLYNQSDVVARISATSTSIFEVLNGKMDGTTSLTKKRGIKLATTISLEHQNVQGNHECAVSLSKRSIETSTANTVKIGLPFLNLEFDQEIAGNTQTKPSVTTKNKLKYMFNIPMIESAGKGTLDMHSELEALSSYVSLDTSIQGKSDITIMDIVNIVQDLDNKVTFYLNGNGLRTTFTTSLNSNLDKQEKQKRSSGDNIIHFDMVENLALELSLRRMFATIDYTSNNNVNLASFNTNGNHVAKGDLDLVPLKSFKTTLDIDVKQPSSLGHVGLIRNINLGFTSEKQSFNWIAKEQLASFIHACHFVISNDESEARMDLSESMEGHLAFLKSIKIPVYQKTIWDVLKFDQVTKTDNLQVLNISSSVVYTKSMDGQEYAIPSKLFENGVIFNIPEFSITVPGWIKEIPSAIRKIDMRFEETEIPDHVTIPPTLSIPAFDVPFTNLHVEPFTFDPKNLNIPKVITTTAFDIILPGLPIVSVPSYDINTEYLQGKMSFLSFRIPQYELTVSSFTLPKSLTIGDTTIDLDDIKTHISNLELPTIVIPEQKIEIPEIDLHLPSSVFIPSFGALSATLKVASPIYNVSTTASVEKKDSSLVTSLNSLCTSTMIFLEYDLTATANIGFDNGLLSLNGKCNLIHSDVNVKWQHVFERNLRMKRQTSSPDTNVFRHTLIVDITSPTFADVGYRFAARKDGITASVSSPSTGFLGLHLQRRSPSQLFGKLSVRFLATPEKDTDILTIKATLRNSQKLTLQTSWNMDTLRDVMEGTKDRIPAMTQAILKIINKYHTAHFGFDLNRGGMKLKNTMSNAVERAYHEFPLSFNELQNSVERLGDQGMDMYRKASDDLMSFRLEDLMEKLDDGLKEIDKHMWGKISELDNALRKFLEDTKFTVPGFEEQLSGLEIVSRTYNAAVRVSDRAIKRFVNLLEKIASYIKEIEFTIPGTDVVVSGQEILKQIDSSVRSAMTQLRNALKEWSELINEKINTLYQLIVQNVEDFINYLNNENKKIASRVEGVYAEVRQSSKEHVGEARRLIAEYKDFTKEQIQEVYDAFNVDSINEDTKEFLSILQSHLSSVINNSLNLMSKASESTSPYVKISSRRMEIEIPLPFLWKSFSEWPTSSRQ